MELHADLSRISFEVVKQRETLSSPPNNNVVYLCKTLPVTKVIWTTSLQARATETDQEGWCIHPVQQATQMQNSSLLHPKHTRSQRLVPECCLTPNGPVHLEHTKCVRSTETKWQHSYRSPTHAGHRIIKYTRYFWCMVCSCGHSDLLLSTVLLRYVVWCYAEGSGEYLSCLARYMFRVYIAPVPSTVPPTTFLCKLQPHAAGLSGTSWSG